jgi:hypothetical protein
MNIPSDAVVTVLLVLLAVVVGLLLCPSLAHQAVWRWNEWKRSLAAVAADGNKKKKKKPALDDDDNKDDDDDDDADDSVRRRRGGKK